MFITWLIVSRKLNQPRWSSIDEQKKYDRYVHAMGYSSICKEKWNYDICKQIDGTGGNKLRKIYFAFLNA